MEKNFSLTISLDGPKEIHDKHRKFVNSAKGSFEVNLNLIKQRHPKFYESNVLFNTVLDSTNTFSCVNEFVMSDALLKDNLFSSGLISQNYIQDVQEAFSSNDKFGKSGITSILNSCSIEQANFLYNIYQKCFSNNIILW